MENATDLKSVGLTALAGSIPALGTRKKKASGILELPVPFFAPCWQIHKMVLRTDFHRKIVMTAEGEYSRIIKR